MAVPNLGTLDDGGSCDVSSKTLLKADIRPSGYPEIDALLNWWGSNQSSVIAAKMQGSSNWDPFLTVDQFPFLSAPNVGVQPAADEVPWVRANAPNPFRDRTQIVFQVPKARSPVGVEVYTVTGRLILKQEQDYEPGIHNWSWDGRDVQGRVLSSGIYLYRLTIGSGFSKSGRMLIVR